MTTTVPKLTDWQLQLGALVLGPDTPYDVVELEGLAELPGLRDDDEDRPGHHGQTSGPDKADGRTITIELEVMGTPDVTYAAAIAALQRTAVPTEDGALLPLWFKLPTTPVLRLDVKVRKRPITTDSAYEMGLAEAVLQLRAPMPWAYGPERTISTPVTSPGGAGLRYPLTYPLDYGDPGSNGRLVLRNDGTAAASPTYTAWGPVDAAGLELVDVATGRRLVYAAAIPAGSWVVINTSTGRVLERGTASRRFNLTRAQWAPVPPGQTSTVKVNALGVPQLTARVDAAWADPYWL